MVPQLRHRHKLIWLILAIALPLLFLLSVLSIPSSAEQYETTTLPEKQEQVPATSDQNSLKDE